MSYRVAAAIATIALVVFAVDSLRQPSPPGFIARFEAGSRAAGKQAMHEQRLEMNGVERRKVSSQPYSKERDATLVRLEREHLAFVKQVEDGKGAPSLDWIFAFHLALAGAGIVTLAFARHVRKSPELEPIPVQGALVALAVASACLIGRAGSDTNYLMEPLALFLIAAGIGLGRGGTGRRVAIVLLLLGYLAIGWTSIPQSDARPDALKGRDGAFFGILRSLENMPEPILSEEPSFPALAGMPMLFQPFMYRQIYNAGQWDPSPLVEAIRRQEFSAIIRRAGSTFDAQTKTWSPLTWFTGSTFPPPVADAMNKYYKPDPKTLAVERVTPTFQLRWALWVPRIED